MVNRGIRFTQLLGAELKGAIIARGATAAEASEALGHSEAALSRWLNGKSQLPMRVFENVCEYIEAEPKDLVGRAHHRLLRELGAYAGPVVELSQADVILAARDADGDAESEAQMQRKKRPLPGDG